MGVPKKIIQLLDKKKVKYKILEHKTVYTAIDKAKTLKVPEKIVGKSVFLKVNRDLIVCLIGADKNLDFQKLKKIFPKSKIELAKEKLIKEKIKGVKIGAIPPFGNLWKILTLVDSSLKKEKKIIINGGDWKFSIEISPKDLKKIAPDLIFKKISKKKK